MDVLKTRIFAALSAKEIQDEEVMIYRGADCLDFEGSRERGARS